ncbi:sulfotransferase family protein [bacterium]|nr:sulfotransferase family protein [bacterium]
MWENDIIVVSGLPRSGTSLMMQMLVQGGIPVLADEQRTADIDNPRGYYEFDPVKRMHQETSWIAQARGRAIKMVSQHLEHLPSDETYRVLFMERDLTEVLESQAKMLARRGITPTVPADQLRRSFELHLQRVRRWLERQDNVSVLYVPYAEVLADPWTMTARINQFLGDRVQLQGMVSAVDPSLYRNRGDSSELTVAPAASQDQAG